MNYGVASRCTAWFPLYNVSCWLGPVEIGLRLPSSTQKLQIVGSVRARYHMLSVWLEVQGYLDTNLMRLEPWIVANTRAISKGLDFRWLYYTTAIYLFKPFFFDHYKISRMLYYAEYKRLVNSANPGHYGPCGRVTLTKPCPHLGR